MTFVKFILVFAVVGFAVGVGGCAAYGPTAPPVTPAMAKASSTPAETLQAGRELFATRCTSCHNADPVRSLDADDWHRVVNKMAERSKLQANERSALLAYLTAAQ